MAHRLQVVDEVPGAVLHRHPVGGHHAPQVVGHRVSAQRLVVALVVVLVQVGHGELAQARVNRVAPAQADAVGLGDRAPAAVAPEQRHHVVEILHRLQVEQQRRLALDPQRAGGEHGALDAVRAALAQHPAHGIAGFALLLEILLEPVQEGLDLFRRAQAAQHGKFTAAEAERLPRGSSFSHRL